LIFINTPENIKTPAGIDQPAVGYLFIIKSTAVFPNPLISAPDVCFFTICKTLKLYANHKRTINMKTYEKQAMFLCIEPELSFTRLH